MVKWSRYLVINKIHMCVKSVMVKWIGRLIEQYSELNLYLIFRRYGPTLSLVEYFGLEIKIYKLILAAIIQDE